MSLAIVKQQSAFLPSRFEPLLLTFETPYPLSDGNFCLGTDSGTDHPRAGPRWSLAFGLMVARLRPWLREC